MASYGLIMNQIALDSEFYVWGSGQDIRRYNGTSWEYYDHTNSAVPSGFPYFLDTRSIDIDGDDVLWAGVAQGPTAGLNEFAVFSMDTNDVSIGDTWKFSDLGVFDQPQEISLVYACPFGDDVLAFSTPLNGVGGTGTTGYTEVNGVTGGRLFHYYKEIDKWQETVPGYKWPHIYDIKAKGFEGKDYFYYIATSEGLFTIPQGSQEVQYLSGTGEIIEQAEVYNTKTSDILSDKIYSLDLDEDGNLWIGTDIGICFFNGKKFWNYPANVYFGSSGLPVTKIISRPNGHVFFTLGDGELGQGTGFWHFNGTSAFRFEISNPLVNMVNDNVLDLKLIKHNTKQGNSTLYGNSLWVLCYNDLAYFNYDQPHVYGSSKHIGATGWNFTYFNDYEFPINAPLAKVNKYTWEYPEWRVYQDEYLAKMFPGLDERNLFLTTKLSDIADGSAGKQAYWDNWPIASFEEKQIEKLIYPPFFNDQIALAQLSPPDPIRGSYTGNITITCSTTVKTRHGIKYYVGGYLTGNVEATFGYDNLGNPITLENLNPTLGGSYPTGTYPSYSQDSGAMGFVVCYNEYGVVDTIIPFRGYKTYVQDIAPSEDDNFVAVSGYFSRFMEDGPYIWDSLESENALRGGPTGAPAGLTNANYYNDHKDEYPWVSGNSTIGAGYWNYVGGSVPTVAGAFAIGLGPNVTFEDIEWLSFNYFDDNGDNKTSTLRTLVTGNVLNIFDGSSFNTSYIIDSIESLSNSSGLYYNVSYATGTTGAFTLAPGNACDLTCFDTKVGVFPSVKGLAGRTSYWNTNSLLCNSPFVAKIAKDLGSVTSFSGLGVNSDYSEDVRKSYRGLGFRHFPAKYASKSSDIKDSKVDITKYSINLSLKSSISYNGSGRSIIKTADISTLKNLWKRTSDGYYTSDKILGTTYPISQTWTTDSVLSYVRLLSEDLSLATTVTSSSYQYGPLTSSIRLLGSGKSMHNDSSTMITGVSSRSFSMGGIDFIGTEGTYNQFYLIIDSAGVGLKGGYLDGKSGSVYVPKVTNNQSVYYITTEFGASGSYFGNNFVADSATGAYFLTATVSEQGTPKEFYKTFIGLPSASTYLIDVALSGSDQYYISYKTNVTKPYNHVMKTDMEGRILSDINFGDAFINSFTSTSDDDGNIFMSGYYTNYNSINGNSYINLPANSGFGLLSRRYKPELGLNMGQIISRPGSGAWTWCDVHSTDKVMQIPLMTTVVFNNYASNLYGKKNNKWILSNSVTGEELLNVKNTPYFIYTFTAPGNYTISNSVEDAAGNVYVQSNPGYIEVVNHKQKNPDDRNPDFVDSFDYGQPEAFPGRDYQARKLAKDLAADQASILNDEIVPFGVGFTVYHNPDATFRQD